MNFENILNLIIIALSAVLLLLILITIKKKKVSYTEKKTTVVNTATVKLDKTQFKKLEKNTNQEILYSSLIFFTILAFIVFFLSYYVLKFKTIFNSNFFYNSFHLINDGNFVIGLIIPVAVFIGIFVENKIRRGKKKK